ncbi:epoxide hydrolase, soluble (sEH) [Savitreella phatthalungensis]
MAWTPVNTGHEDLVTDLAYDYYGQRVVTCSADRTLRVFDIAPSSTRSTEPASEGTPSPGTWTLSASWKCADAPVLRVSWAFPEHGQIVACASADRTVRVFEEQDHEPGCASRWVERAKLTDARGGVHDLAFAPAHAGLRLASVAGDGVLRVYEALEPSNLSRWTLMEDVGVVEKRPLRETEASFCLSWCPSRFCRPTIAVGAMDAVKLYTQDSAGKWRPGPILPHGGLVRDVEWAPAVGRTYHLLATACKDGHVRVFKLKEQDSHPPESGDHADDTHTTLDNDDHHDHADSHTTWHADLIADHDDHGAQVWRVSFNATGTVLSTAGDDAKVRLWKSSLGGEIRCVSVCSLQQPRSRD